MRIHRFLSDKFNFDKKNFCIDEREFFNQIKNVLRLKPGEKIILGNEKNEEVYGKIIEIGKNFIEIEIFEKKENKKEPKIETILYCSILKKENFELVAQKATEIGIKEIQPIICKRTVKLDFKEERIKKIIKEASEQSGRGIVPLLHRPFNFENVLKNSQKNDCNLFFAPESDFLNTDIFKNKNLKRIGIFIGPEGGWDEEELKLAEKYNLQKAGLGKLTLRSETAAIVASFLVINSI